MKVYLVGGAVRDELLGLQPGERDWVVVGARPEDLLDAGYRQVGRDFPVFLHPETGEEYALARTERKSGHGYHGFHVHAAPDVTLEQDLQRRDLTVNAMARDEDGTLIDPCGGRDDLERRVLRHVSPAFEEDPLRVLRVARFAAALAAFDFRVADETRSLMQRMSASGELETLAGERVWQETEKALAAPAPARYFEVLDDCGALERVLPELAPLFADGDGVEALGAVCARTGDPALRFAALAHSLDPGDALAALGRRLPVPGSWIDLAGLLGRWLPLIRRAPTAAPREIEACLTGTDVLRRPERFERLLAVAEMVAADAAPGCEHLRKAAAAFAAVEAGPLVEAGWQGRALGDELRRLRRQALERLQGGSREGSGSE
ncbi:MAG: multifunctional CCA tRNA nucleotidyl transferase/2'3'-cyclic phosphodiesterase/2'nucleotidase/phosphatase [Halofilum sp. (in: g-proteobacteria)]|nr:multifunctional CCA tRNA nucleotidyl transferase/2'3'-cyclic phosphodiesterase/2'nucleotidase/phosphatase [Halofilum sp. (in: g-proteobacteria)]